MDKFTASNGLTVDGTTGRIIVRDRTVFPKYDLGKHTVEALREFFRAERDEELGRWRWPDNPDYVVYQHGSGQAIVINERTGISFYRYRGEAAELREMRAGTDEDVSLGTKAAEAYFDAHPERPAAGAKAGEVWELTMDDGSEHIVFVHADRTTGGRDGLSAGGAYFDIDDASHVTSARKVWGPEVSS